MLNFANRKANQPIQDWRHKQKSRCFAQVATETDCPASDCGWDEFHNGPIKADCLVCGGRGRLITFVQHEFMAIPVWGADRFAYLAPAPGTELGDCELGIEKNVEWLMDRVMESQTSYLNVDGKILRPSVMSPNIVPQVGEAIIVTCKLFTNTN